MSDTDFLPFTLLAGAAFGCSLLWVLVQWLRADEIAESVEREVQANMLKLAARDSTEAGSAAPGDSGPGASQMDPSAEDLAREAYEAQLASLLWWWGFGGAVTGMALGGLWSSYNGALMGGIVAPVLTTIGVMVWMKLKPAPIEETKPSTTAPAETENSAQSGTGFADRTGGAY
jgi:hypothetical protein